MRIIERELKSKSGIEAECEDLIFVSNDFIAVIDGVTSKSTVKYGNAPSGRLSACIISDALGHLDFDIEAQQAVEFLSNAIYSIYEQNNVIEYLKNHPEDKASSCVIIYSKFRREIWIVGDCQCMIDGVNYTNKKIIDGVLANARSIFLETENLLGNLDPSSDVDKGREFILPLLLRQSLFQNCNYACDYSYGVIDGFAVPAHEVKIITLSPDDKIIVLASDGYPFLHSTLAQSEKHLKKILQIDPLCYKEYKATKGVYKNNISFDDRAYIKFYI